MTRYIIVGNGVAGTTAAESIRSNDPDGEIIILTEEKLPYYYRIRLIDYLGGDIDEEKLVARDADWYRKLNIDLETGTRVTAADPAGKVVVTADRKEFPYDRLLLATGSSSFVPPIIGADKGKTFTLRTIEDARVILSCCHGGEAVLIGGGLLGLEAGNALRRRGMQVSVVEFFPRLLPRQLDQKGADKLKEIMEAMGFTFYLGTSVNEIQGGETVERVLLDNGDVVPTDLVIISAGVRPNLELAGSLGLECGRGIRVDATLRTSRPDVFAAGDVAEFEGNVYGIWPAALQQGRIAGLNMAGGNSVYTGTTPANKLKVAGIDLASVGEIDAESHYRAEIEETDAVYKKMVYDNGRLIGCIMLGDTSDYARVMKRIAEK